jgi:Ras family protein A
MVPTLEATPAESLLESQSIDGDADSRSIQTNEDAASRGFAFLEKPLERCERKAVLVGDGACGKSALLRVLTEGRFPDEYCCGNLFQKFVANIEVDDTSIELALWDTPGQEDYDKSRPISYDGVHVVLICFSIDNPDSLGNIHEKWIHEVSNFCPEVPIVLVGTKSDLRHDAATIVELRKTKQHPITYREAVDAQIKIGARAYVECSAKLNFNVAEVFDTAVKCSLQPKPTRAKRRKSLLRMFGMTRD